MKQNFQENGRWRDVRDVFFSKKREFNLVWLAAKRYNSISTFRPTELCTPTHCSTITNSTQLKISQTNQSRTAKYLLLQTQLRLQKHMKDSSITNQGISFFTLILRYQVEDIRSTAVPHRTNCWIRIRHSASMTKIWSGAVMRLNTDIYLVRYWRCVASWKWWGSNAVDNSICFRRGHHPKIRTWGLRQCKFGFWLHGIKQPFDEKERVDLSMIPTRDLRFQNQLPSDLFTWLQYLYPTGFSDIMISFIKWARKNFLTWDMKWQST